MCKAMEDMRNESLKEGIKEGIKTTAARMLEAGKYAVDEISAITGLSQDEIMELEVSQRT